MARGVALLGAALCLLGCAQPSSQPIAPRPIDAVLAYEAQVAHPGPAPCVAARTQGATFRSLFARGAEYDWLLPLPPAGPRSVEPPPMDAALAAELSASIRRILADRSPVAAAPLALGPLPAPLLPHGQADCHGDLELAAPAVSGDLAFVDTLDICGENCAHGMLYALRREGDGWRVVAIAGTGIT